MAASLNNVGKLLENRLIENRANLSDDALLHLSRGIFRHRDKCHRWRHRH